MNNTKHEPVAYRVEQSKTKSVLVADKEQAEILIKKYGGKIVPLYRIPPDNNSQIS